MDDYGFDYDYGFGDDEPVDDVAASLEEGDYDGAPLKKRTKKAPPPFKEGDLVTYRKKGARVVYGPWFKDSKALYELQYEESGMVVTAHAQSVTARDPEH